MRLTAAILTMTMLCLMALLAYAGGYVLIALAWRLQQLESNMVPVMMQQDGVLENQGRIEEKLDGLLDIFAGATMDEFEVTAYAPLDPRAVEGMCYSGDLNVTASGLPPIPGETVAAGPGIPFGSRVWIEGVGIRTVNDRGGRIHDRALDVVMETRAEALRFERQQLRAVVW